MSQPPLSVMNISSEINLIYMGAGLVKVGEVTHLSLDMNKGSLMIRIDGDDDDDDGKEHVNSFEDFCGLRAALRVRLSVGPMISGQ